MPSNGLASSVEDADATSSARRCSDTAGPQTMMTGPSTGSTSKLSPEPNETARIAANSKSGSDASGVSAVTAKVQRSSTLENARTLGDRSIVTTAELS